MERCADDIRAEAWALARADAMLNFYSKILGSADLREDGYENVLTDLLTDLAHFYSGRGLNFEELLDRAMCLYEDERGQAPEQCLPSPTQPKTMLDLWTPEKGRKPS